MAKNVLCRRRSGTGSGSLCFDPPAWHNPRIGVNFLMASVAGFLLTAIPSWTGQLPVRDACSLCSGVCGCWPHHLSDPPLIFPPGWQSPLICFVLSGRAPCSGRPRDHRRPQLA